MTQPSWHRSSHSCRSTHHPPHALVQLSHGTHDETVALAHHAGAGEDDAVLERVADALLPTLIRRL